MSYVDTCVVMMSVNKDDELRKKIGVGRGDIDSILRNGSFCIPMVALGESLHMIRQKNPRDYEESLSELNRLLDKEFFETRFLKNPESTFTIARDLCSFSKDERDSISPMDAIIIASATTDGNCTSLYTSDTRLLSNGVVSEEVDDWRQSHGYGDMSIRNVTELFKGKQSKRY